MAQPDTTATTTPVSSAFSTVIPEDALNLDIFYGVTLSILSAMGIVGNIFALVYFLRKRKKTVHDVMYTFVSGLDMMTSTIAWPVTISLLTSQRYRVLFEDGTFCGIWTVSFMFLNVITLFVVMLISVSRSINIICPFHKITAPVIITAILVYAVVDLLLPVIGCAANFIEFAYYKDMGFCSIVPQNLKNPSVIKFWDGVFVPTKNVQLLGTMLIVVTSFLVSVVSLMTRSNAAGRKETKMRQASITIAIFTGIFLFCQLPLHVTKMMSHSIKWFNTYDYFSLKSFIGWSYSILFQVLFPVLNSAVNPCLYYIRMPKYKLWVQRYFREGFHAFRKIAVVEKVFGPPPVLPNVKISDYDYSTIQTMN
ncbi:hypothetical protein ACHWQZ_G000218 [Mnemiopsis leidyi]